MCSVTRMQDRERDTGGTRRLRLKRDVRKRKNKLNVVLGMHTRVLNDTVRSGFHPGQDTTSVRAGGLGPGQGRGGWRLYLVNWTVLTEWPLHHNSLSSTFVFCICVLFDNKIEGFKT